MKVMKIRTRLQKLPDRTDQGGDVYSFQIRTFASPHWITAGELVVTPQPDDLYHVSWIPGELGRGVGAVFQTSVLNQDQYLEMMERLTQIMEIACPTLIPLPSTSERL